MKTLSTALSCFVVLLAAQTCHVDSCGRAPVAEAVRFDLGPLEMWGGRKAHPAVVHSVTAVPEDPWTLSLRGEWEIVQNKLSPSRP